MLRRRGIGRAGRPSLVGTAARTAVVAGTATAVVGGVSGAQQAKAQQRAAEQAAEPAAEPAAAAPPPPPPSSPQGAGTADERISQLERLAQLHQQGMLTAEEFAAEKAKLLSS